MRGHHSLRRAGLSTRPHSGRSPEKKRTGELVGVALVHAMRREIIHGGRGRGIRRVREEPVEEIGGEGGGGGEGGRVGCWESGPAGAAPHLASEQEWVDSVSGGHAGPRGRGGKREEGPREVSSQSRCCYLTPFSSKKNLQRSDSRNAPAAEAQSIDFPTAARGSLAGFSMTKSRGRQPYINPGDCQSRSDGRLH